MNNPRLVSALICALAAALLFGVRSVRAQSYPNPVLTKLGDFNGDNGQSPTTGVIFGRDGNLYGTTSDGGSTTVNPPFQGCVFTVSPAGGNLQRFVGFGDVRALHPYAPLILGSDGNFYGTAAGGSINGNTSNGTIYQLKPDGTLTALFSFPYDSVHALYPDGESPEAPLLEISPGVFVGTCPAGGGEPGDSLPPTGTVFTFNANTGAFTRTTAHGYGPNPGNDGNYQLLAPLVSGHDGFFYGTSSAGGPGDGSIFRYSGGPLTSLYFFNDNTGKQPSGGLTFGPDGKFYGTTLARGGSNLGVYYRIATDGTFELLGSFNGAGNGGQPYGELVLATDGNFYGTTSSGGSGGLGTVFQLTPAGVLTTVYSFPQPGTLGLEPHGTLVQGPDGRLYGTTSGGGVTGASGTVFALSLNPAVTSASSAAVDAGQAFSYQVTATNNPTSFAAAGLPDGLSINPATGLVSGTLARSGVFTVTLSATNGMGTGKATLNINGHPSFFAGEVALSQGVYYLAFPQNGNIFGYYEYLSDPNFLYHFDLGFEYVFDAADGHSGVYLYDFKSNTFWYTSPTFAFPYLYDFGLQAFLYYYPDPANPQRYNTNGVRYFYNFSTGAIISK